MEKLNQTSLTLIFCLFLALAISSWLFLNKKTFFQWKINLIVLITGLSLLAIVGFLLNYFSSLEMMLLGGSILLAPLSIYFSIVLRNWLRDQKNEQKIHLEKRRRLKIND